MKLTIGIGDVHGMRDELTMLLGEVIRAYPKDELKFVFVGDYVDRGPDSRGVVDDIMELAKKYEVITLRGNHEQMLLDAVDKSQRSDFLGNGGIQTLASYGIHYDSPEFRDFWVKTIPTEHMSFFRKTFMYHQDGQRTFVHAGIMRSRNHISKQSDECLLWVRHEFLTDPSMDGGFIVHGHTPFMNQEGTMEYWPNRVNLDTGAVFGDVLSAAVFTDEKPGPITHHRVKASNKHAASDPVVMERIDFLEPTSFE